MKKGNPALCLGLGALCAGAGLLWMLAPGRSSREKRAPFEKRYFAHRGLYDEKAGVPENSLAAFRAAAEHGYGAELDVRMTRDGFAVISHDSSLKRMTGADVNVEDCDLAGLEALRLSGTEEKIPLLTQAMDILAAAGVPVIVEVKTTPRARRDALCSAALDVMDRYDNPMCVESFDPMIVRWFRLHAPDLLRGALITQPEDVDLPPVKRFLGCRGLFNFLGRPQFIAHRLGKKLPTVRLAEWLGAMRVCWTAGDRTCEKRNDAVIFEHCRPPVRYL
jgi:glycerophosphoryl diester phosphodiesterase